MGNIAERDGVVIVVAVVVDVVFVLATRWQQKPRFEREALFLRFSLD